jgi:hypothetical protein
MYYYDQMSYKEIAAALKITVSTVGTNILKAKKTLKNIMDREERIGGEDISMLRGVAIAPALVHAFDAELGRISAAEVEILRQKCAPQIAAYVRSPGGAAAKTAASAGKFLALGLSVLVAVLGIVFVGIDSRAKGVSDIAVSPQAAAAAEPSDEPGRADPAAPYLPDAQIVLQSADGQPGQVNPYEATLTIADGTAVGWNILSAAGEIVVSGEGTSFRTELGVLPPGKYRIEWQVQNENGQTARVVREIEMRQ